MAFDRLWIVSASMAPGLRGLGFSVPALQNAKPPPDPRGCFGAALQTKVEHFTYKTLWIEIGAAHQVSRIRSC